MHYQRQPDFSEDPPCSWPVTSTDSRLKPSSPRAPLNNFHRHPRPPNQNRHPQYNSNQRYPPPSHGGFTAVRPSGGRGHFQQNFKAQSPSPRGFGQRPFNPRFSSTFNGGSRGPRQNSFPPPAGHNGQQWRHKTAQQPEGGNPWITPEIQKMIEEKDEMWKIYLEQRTDDSYRLFKIKRIEVNMAVNDAKIIYFQKNPQQGSYIPYGHGKSSKPKPTFYCDPCEKKFISQETLDAHKEEHITCKLDGCTYTAHVKLVMKHIELQHSTNLFHRIKGYETPEEIEKWKEERRKNFPTPENIARKKAEWEERKARGETLHTNILNPLEDPELFRHKIVPERKSQTICRRIGPEYQSDGDEEFIPKRPRREGEREYRRTPAPISRFNKSPIITLLNFYTDIEVNSQGQLVGFNREAWKAQDGGDLDNEIKNFDKGENEEEQSAEFNITDDEEEQESASVGEISLEKEKSDLGPSNLGSSTNNLSLTTQTFPDESAEDENTDIKNKSGGLLGLMDYSSSSEDELDLEEGEVNSESGDEMPDENPQDLDPALSDGEEPDELPASVSKSNETTENYHYFPKSNNNDTNTDSTNVPDTENTKKSTKASGKVKLVREREANVKNIVRPRPKYTLLQRLLAPEIRKERNIILQACRYVVENDFFDPKD